MTTVQKQELKRAAELVREAASELFVTPEDTRRDLLRIITSVSSLLDEAVDILIELDILEERE